MKSKLGTNVQQLRKIYEPCFVERNSSVNNLNHTTIAAIYHMMFTLTMLKENTVLSFWKYLSYGEKTFGIIVFVNVAIYLAWNVTKWKSTMLKYFIINEDKSNSVWSNLLSAFSHTSLWNLTANVIYLYYPLCKLGFVRAWPISIFPPYMGIEEFFVFYISACTFSSLSRIYIEPKLNISNKKSKYGASGAISAVFGYTALGFPNRKLLTIPIIVEDQLSVDITAFEALLCLFLLIVLIVFVMQFSWINSTSIISGCIFGIFWYKLGSKIIWDNRKYLTKILENNNYIPI
ncbi:presenilins-associated rhomboid-like protein, mitochondrial isoform X3 [Aphis gossypii]|uniref:rhomboid protease n=1 Tax=Aphis gossypii TaxID=80765 RepID=A0A9P0IWK7_APHGO|nr:presenilins-associated rhomboid-like protein, mitochondrial isoform X3 [Aphis gossypii]CAH1720180.1 unnamed protein product [Aphis gossypii]